MVYFKTNYIKECNTWVIRKVRPFVFPAMFGFLYIHFTLYDFLGRRVMFYRKYLDWRTNDEKNIDAKNQTSNFGYRPRYEPTYERSIKKRKYEGQTLQESLLDTPRLVTNYNKSCYTQDYGIDDPEETDSFFFTALDHARRPGTFDYTQPQTYHAVFPEIEQEAYVTVGGTQHRKLKISNFSI